MPSNVFQDSYHISIKFRILTESLNNIRIRMICDVQIFVGVRTSIWITRSGRRNRIELLSSPFLFAIDSFKKVSEWNWSLPSSPNPSPRFEPTPNKSNVQNLIETHNLIGRSILSGDVDERWARDTSWRTLWRRHVSRHLLTGDLELWRQRRWTLHVRCC